MAKVKDPENSVEAQVQETERRTELLVDDSNANVNYSTTVHINGSPEEFALDFSRGVRPGPRPNTAVLRVDSKVILSPWAAKRLAIELSQAVQRYEETFGTLEIDPRKRSKS